MGTIAGAVALVAASVATFGGAAIAAASVAGIASVSTIATVAGLVSGVAAIGANLTAKPPRARGSVTQVLIAVDPPQPYVMGEGYFAGVLRYEDAYGATLNKVPHPYKWMVVVYSGGGPTQSVTPYVDKAAIDSWYSSYLSTDTQLGATPESTALAPTYSGAPGWDAGSKLSGQAAIGWNLKFDKKGKRFASGIPQLGAYGQWVKAYDPRLDSTFPGGSGSHRLGDETTYTWTENPALHAGTYAYGRFQNGKRTIGAGMPEDAIDWSSIAAWANVCDSNDWTIFGVIYEGAGDEGARWANIKAIAEAGGAQPVVSSGGLLSFRYAAPQVPLDTITVADLAEPDVQITAMRSWSDRLNAIVPKYTSADHEWEQIAAAKVSVPTFLTEDGEEKVREWPFNLVKDVDQASQMAMYQLWDAREIAPIVLPCGPRMRHYRPGECLTLDLPDYGLNLDVIILQREIDPASMTVTLTVTGETPGKHAYALGLTGTPPPTPALGQTAQERDEAAAGARELNPEVAANEAALVGLNVPVGAIAYDSDAKKSYVFNGGDTGTIADWTRIATDPIIGP